MDSPVAIHPPNIRIRPPKQDRSRRTLERISEAALEIMEERGVEAATVAAIVERYLEAAPFAMHGDAVCLLLNGRMDESVERTRELAMINPFTFVQNLPLSFHLYLARRYDEALEVTLAIQERFPNAPVHTNLFLIYWAQGLFAKAMDEERQWLSLQNDDDLLAALERGLADAGPAGAERAMAETLVARSGERYVDPFRISEAFARSGDVDEALLWLNRAAEEGSFELTHLAYRQDFEGLQGDPRFRDLLIRLGHSQAPGAPQN